METQNSILEYLATTKIGEKGRLTVPKQFREELGLVPAAPGSLAHTIELRVTRLGARGRPHGFRSFP